MPKDAGLRRASALIALLALMAGVAAGQDASADAGIPAVQTKSAAIGAPSVQTESAALADELTSVPTERESVLPGSESAADLGAEDESRTFHVDITGRKTWTLAYGFGHPLGLALAGFSAGQISLDQTLAVDFTAEAIEILSVVAHLDDQESDVMQTLAVYLDTERLDGVVGDFSLGDIGGAAAYNKKLLGLRLDYYLGDATITGVASQFEGISESQTFTGDTASDEIEYAAFRTDRPWAEASYRYHIDGLYAFELEAPYVEDFTDAKLLLQASVKLTAVLETFGLGYLGDVLDEHGTFELDDSDFTTIYDGTTFLLKNELADYAREIVEDAIDAYNDGLDDDDETRTYPFVVDSDYEADFLGQLEGYLHLVVGDQSVAGSDAIRERFYDLGTTDVVESSVWIEVTLDGLSYRTLYEPEFSDYSFEVHPDEGILECKFPAEFFASDAPGIRVDFDYYAITSGLFILGLSVIPESERVYLNDELLDRDTDYYIDYESGILILDESFEITETDVLVIEYEVYSGGLGGGSDYASYFYGLALDLPLGDLGSLQASLLRSQDDPASSESEDTAETMPNKQTVVALSADLAWDDFRTQIDVGYNDEYFPFDHNLRDNEANEITAIAATSRYTVLGHLDGFAAYAGDDWRSYDTANGLSGASVRAIAFDEDKLYFATNSGLTVVSLEGVSPFDRVSNWVYYSEGDGPPDGSTRAVAVFDGVLWLATDDGVAYVRTDEIDDPNAWTVCGGEAFDGLGIVYELAGDGSAIYVGTETGAYRYDVDSDQLERISGAATDPVHDLALSEGTLYVASDRGLRAYVDGVPSTWRLEETAVLSVLVVDGIVYAGTESGLVVLDGDETTLHDGWPITALGVGAEDALWVGTRANAEYLLMIWRHGESVEAFDNETALIDGTDPRHYIDVDREEHRSQGLSARTSFEQVEDAFSVYGSIETISPEYHAVGSLSRTDWTGWRVGAEGTLANSATWSVDHEYQMSDLRSESPTGRSEAGFALDWPTEWGPEVSLSVRQEAISDDWTLDGAETTYLSIRGVVRESLFSDRLSVRLRWNDVYDVDHVDATADRDTTLSASVDAALLEALDVAFGWSRPVDVSESDWRGSETWTWGSQYEAGLSFGSLEIDYEGERYASLSSTSSSWENDLGVTLYGSRFELGGWSVTPRLILEAAQADDVAVDGRLTLSGRRSPWSVTAIVDGSVEGLWDDVVTDEEKLTVTARYSGWENVSPYVRIRLERDASTYEGEVKASHRYRLDGTLDWEASQTTEDSLSIRLDVFRKEGANEADLTIANSYRTDVTSLIGERLFPSAKLVEDGDSTALTFLVDADLDASVDTEEADFDASVSGALNLAIGAMWGGTLRASYYAGTKSAGGLYHSLLLELTVAIDFAFTE